MMNTIEYKDLKTFFEKTYAAECTVESKTVKETETDPVTGSELSRERSISYLKCSQNTVRGLPVFTAYLNGFSKDAEEFDLKCRGLENGALICYSQANDFNFTIGKKDTVFKILGGHYISFHGEQFERTKLLDSFINSAASDAFWVPASW